MQREQELYTATTLKIACDGGGGALGHPRVFLHIDPDSGHITCPYCSRVYVWENAHNAAEA